MKIFNWVHRRFLHVHPANTASIQEDNELEIDARSKGADVEKHALLNNWNDGILAIGTLAIGPLETGNCEVIEEEEDDYLDDIDDDDNDHDDTVSHDFEGSPLMKMALLGQEREKVDIVVGKEIEEVADENVVKFEDSSDVCKSEGQSKRRVTLADLFLEDSDHHIVRVLKERNDDPKDVILVAKPTHKVKSNSHAKKGLSKAKKLLKEELRPLKKLNQFMKRMMKKKIHPDMGGKMQKDIEMQPSNNQDGPNESASLLLIQDSVV